MKLMDIVIRVFHAPHLLQALCCCPSLYMHQRLEAGFWFGPQTYCSEIFPSEQLQRAFILYCFLAVYLLPLLTIAGCYAFTLERMGQVSVNPKDCSYQVRRNCVSCSSWWFLWRRNLFSLALSCRLRQGEQQLCRPKFPECWW